MINMWKRINNRDMRTKFLILAAIVFGFGAKAQSDSSNYTLQKCIEYALSNNSVIKNAHLDYESSEAKVKETTAIGLPQVNGKIDFIDYLKVQSQFLPANAFDPSAPAGLVAPVAFGVQYSSNASITATQLIFDGSYIIGLRAAKTYKELYQKTIDQSKVDVVENVSKAYYGALVAKQRLELLKNNKSLLEKLYSDTKIMYEVGVVDKVSLQRISVSKNNLEVEISKLESFVEISYALLKFQMGMSLSDPLIIEDDLESVVGDLKANNEVSGSPSARPDYQQLQVQMKLMELDLKNEKVNAYPKLGAFGTLGANIGSFDFGGVFKFNDWQNYSMVGLQLDVPIFSSMRRKHRITQSKITIEKLENNLSMLEQSIEVETLQHKMTLKNNLKSIQIQDENMDLAKEVYNTTKLKYDEGMASNYEVVDAETSLKEAQTNYYAALYDAIMSNIALEKAAGTLYSE